MLEDSIRRGRSADRPAPLRGLRDAPKPNDKKLTKIRHDGKSPDALGEIPEEVSAEDLIARATEYKLGNPKIRKEIDDTL
ncbi:MAG: hypothetical protein AAB899_02840 [Patescibacteria group bacterium]